MITKFKNAEIMLWGTLTVGVMMAANSGTVVAAGSKSGGGSGHRTVELVIAVVTEWGKVLDMWWRRWSWVWPWVPD